MSALHVLANRIQGGRVKVEDKLPGLRIGISGAADPQFFQRMAELLLELEAATPECGNIERSRQPLAHSEGVNERRRQLTVGQKALVQCNG